MVNKPSTLVCLTLIACMLTFTITATSAEPTNATYYSNDFSSPTSLNDGYWQATDATVSEGTLQVNGEASFNPQHGDYSLTNFTVQFDVYHDVKYANNTAYSGPFYQLCDSQNRTIILLGYYQIETNDETRTEGGFTDVLNYHHYYFPYNHTTDWSTWRLTGYIQQMTDDGLYWGNFTLQIDNETITSFRSDSILPEGIVYGITNEEVRPITYFNIYPLPQTGVMIIPTASSTPNGIHFTTLANKVATVQYSQALTSFVDNFYYGYANTVPASATTNPTSTPTSTPIPTPTTPELPAAIAIATIALVTLAAAVLVKQKKLNPSKNLTIT